MRDDQVGPGESAAAAWLAGGGEMGGRIRGLDWASTPLGPTAAWPQSLRSAVSILLPSKAQICLFWGPELVKLYNDAYIPVLGQKHPGMLGRPAREVWSEIWDVLGPAAPRRHRDRRRVSRGGLPVLPRSARVHRGDVLRRLVRPGAGRVGQGGRRVLHRQRDHRPGPERAPPPYAARPGARPGRPVPGGGLHPGAGRSRVQSEGRAVREPVSPRRRRRGRARGGVGRDPRRRCVEPARHRARRPPVGPGDDRAERAAARAGDGTCRGRARGRPAGADADAPHPERGAVRGLRDRRDEPVRGARG